MLIASTSFAQSNPTEIEIFQDALGLEKKIAVAKFMSLGDSAVVFWKIYDEYEVERKKLGKERLLVISDYAKNYPNISDKMIQDLFNRTPSQKKAFDKLQETYFNRMKKEVGISKAAQFWQIEGYFNTIILANIYKQIPFIGEHLSGK
ncbi:MAG: hypothetical protein SFU91_14920 [Chloroherpetonaceae bacterium]|nr:hypothetical protein [Chloroherpetonaceae bacterium]